MIFVDQIYRDAQKAFGQCSQTELFKYIGDAVEMLANKGEFDPLIGWVDLCVQNRCFTLPREVETILALNIGRHPTFGRDQLFSFHLNGPGDECGPSCGYTWADGGDTVCFRELAVPSKLVAFVSDAADEGKELWVYGYDENQTWIRTEIDGEMVDGYLVPTVYGVAVPDIGAPSFLRIVRIRKAVTRGPIRLSSFDNSSDTGTLIGIYDWDETTPIYRKAKISRDADWVRICFRRRVFEIRSMRDFIPLHNRLAIVMALRAVKAYEDGEIEKGMAHEVTAIRWLTEEQFTRTPTTVGVPQVDDRNRLHDKNDCVE